MFVPVTGGVGTTVFTVTVTLAVALHPAPLITVTVYVVLDVGLSVIAAVLSPVLHKYVPPPLAVKVVLFPLQIAVVPAIDAGGKTFTATVTVLVVTVHPLVTLQ
jgi:hypothetical protein